VLVPREKVDDLLVPLKKLELVVTDLREKTDLSE